MHKFLVSILILNYNNARFLDRSIKSCLNQSYKKLEILVFDDKSNDNSLSILKKYKKKIKIIVNKHKKKGFAALDAKNGYYRLIENANGQIIFLLDSDDYFKKNKIQEITKFYEKNNKIEFIQDLPLIQMKNQEEKKMNKNNLLSFWPYLSPESCISFRKSFVKNFKKKNRKLENDFKDVWFGFRLGVFAYFVNKSFYSLEKNLTIYKSYGESKKYNTFNFNWFNRRLNSFNYLKKVSQNKINFNLNFDYVITRFILSIFKILK